MLTYDTPAYMFNVHKNQLSRQTGSRNLTGPKTLPKMLSTNLQLEKTDVWTLSNYQSVLLDMMAACAYIHEL
jgi:hypothetical protein